MEPELDSTHKEKWRTAPIASFEDLSDETENGEQSVQMLVISEVITLATPGSSLKTPSTPRIDISRASSSSHHEDSSNSRESSPERELLAGSEPPVGCKLTLNYKEGAQELRSSTEELDLQDPIHEQDFKREAKHSGKRGQEDCTQSECALSMKFQERERKDSSCSEIILLNISGRSSRLSSVGSQGSGHSEKFSVTSNVPSRSPSPHKCLLETSFCGTRPTQAHNLIAPTKAESEDIEKILLRREADTTKVLIPEDVKVSIMGGNLKPDPLDKPRRRGREERKEIFKREVEITKKILEEANIEVKTDGGIVVPEATNSCSKSRRILSVKAKNTSESLKAFPKSQEKLCLHQEVPMNKESRSKSLFCSTLSLFKKKERKKSLEAAAVNSLDNERSGCSTVDIIGHAEVLFNSDKINSENQSKRLFPFSISLSAKDMNDEKALPSESVSIPLETPTKLLDEYESEDVIARYESDVIIAKDCMIDSNKTFTEKSVNLPRNSSISLTCFDKKEVDKHTMHARAENNSLMNFTPKKEDIVKPKIKCKDGQQQRDCSSEGSFADLFINKAKQLQKEQSTNEQNEQFHNFQDGLGKASKVSDLDHNSSESERDSEIEFIKHKTQKLVGELSDERRGLFYEESFEEDTCFVPLILPVEKSIAVPILPARKRHQEVRTIPIERPRSTTPINPNRLDEFVMQTPFDERCAERMKVYLPRVDSFKLKSPRKLTTNTFTEFAGKVLDSGKRNISKTPSPPPIPARIFSTQPNNWINFEDIPEKRKAPKRIQTIPRSDVEERNNTYNFVQPEECRCECHEEQRRAAKRENVDFTQSSLSCSSNGTRPCNGENCIVPKSSNDRDSIFRDKKAEDEDIEEELLNEENNDEFNYADDEEGKDEEDI